MGEQAQKICYIITLPVVNAEIVDEEDNYKDFGDASHFVGQVITDDPEDYEEYLKASARSLGVPMEKFEVYQTPIV